MAIANTLILSALGAGGNKQEGFTRSFEENLSQTMQVAEFGRQQARENAIAAIQLERELYPELYQLRKNAFSSLLSDMGTSTQVPSAMIDRLMSDFYADTAPQLLRDVRQQIIGDFAMGGRLTPDIQREVSRASMVGAGQAGVTGQTAQDIVARDLGISATALRQARQDTALASALEEQSRAEANQAQRLAQASTIDDLLQTDVNRRMQIASLAAGIPTSPAGIDPGSLASYNIALTNAQMEADAAREAARAQASASRSSGLFGFLGKVAGGVLGGLVGG